MKYSTRFLTQLLITWRLCSVGSACQVRFKCCLLFFLFHPIRAVWCSWDNLYPGLYLPCYVPPVKARYWDSLTHGHNKNISCSVSKGVGRVKWVCSCSKGSWLEPAGPEDDWKSKEFNHFKSLKIYHLYFGSGVEQRKEGSFQILFLKKTLPKEENLSLFMVCFDFTVWLMVQLMC